MSNLLSKAIEHRFIDAHYGTGLDEVDSLRDQVLARHDAAATRTTEPAAELVKGQDSECGGLILPASTNNHRPLQHPTEAQTEPVAIRRGRPLQAGDKIFCCCLGSQARCPRVRGRRSCDEILEEERRHRCRLDDSRRVLEWRSRGAATSPCRSCSQAIRSRHTEGRVPVRADCRRRVVPRTDGLYTASATTLALGCFGHLVRPVHPSRLYTPWSIRLLASRTTWN